MNNERPGPSGMRGSLLNSPVSILIGSIPHPLLNCTKIDRRDFEMFIFSFKV